MNNRKKKNRNIEKQKNRIKKQGKEKIFFFNDD